jgi:hypothetical protein
MPTDMAMFVQPNPMIENGVPGSYVTPYFVVLTGVLGRYWQHRLLICFSLLLHHRHRQRMHVVNQVALRC